MLLLYILPKTRLSKHNYILNDQERARLATINSRALYPLAAIFAGFFGLFGIKTAHDYIGPIYEPAILGVGLFILIASLYSYSLRRAEFNIYEAAALRNRE
jgi:hypothetical protein